MNFQRMQAKTDFGSQLFVTIVTWLSSTDFVNLLLPFHWICFHIAKLSGSRIRSWVALYLLVVCSFVRSSVRPDRWHLHLSQLYDVLDHTNHTWCMCGGIWWCLDHIWWCLVVSGACLVVSGARLVMLMDIDWYGLIWCIWADIFSNAHNRCADADALMLLMHWCYWSNDAAVVDKMQICVWAHLKGIALSSEFRTVVQRLVFNVISITIANR